MHWSYKIARIAHLMEKKGIIWSYNCSCSAWLTASGNGENFSAFQWFSLNLFSFLIWKGFRMPCFEDEKYHQSFLSIDWSYDGSCNVWLKALENSKHLGDISVILLYLFFFLIWIFFRVPCFEDERYHSFFINS